MEQPGRHGRYREMHSRCVTSEAFGRIADQLLCAEFHVDGSALGIHPDLGLTLLIRDAGEYVAVVEVPAMLD